jgi:GNAT superfamily N-acetyltransferase
MSMIIRSANAEDRATLVTFIKQLQDAECEVHPSRLPGEAIAEAYYEKLFAQGGVILIACSAGNPIGFVAGWLDEDDDTLQKMEWRRHGLISDLFVVTAHRGKGVAQQLLQAISDRLQERGAKRLRICAVAPNGPAIAAYLRFGFEPFEVLFDKALG